MYENDENKREAAMQDFAMRNTKRKRKMKKSFYFALALILVGTIATLSLTVLFPIKQIVVSGESQYTKEQIISAMSVSVGDNIILADTDKAAAQIVARLPYIGSATISKSLGGELSVQITEASAVYAYKAESENKPDEYILVNDLGKVVEKVNEEPDNLCVMVGMVAQTSEVGQDYIVMSDERKNLCAELLKAFSDNKLSITRLDLTDTLNIMFVLENRVMVKLGTAENLAYKVSHAAATFNSMAKTDEGTLDLTWWTSTKKDAYFRAGDIEELIANNGLIGVPVDIPAVAPATSEDVDANSSNEDEEESSSRSSTSDDNSSKSYSSDEDTTSENEYEEEDDF